MKLAIKDIGKEQLSAKNLQALTKVKSVAAIYKGSSKNGTLESTLDLEIDIKFLTKLILFLVLAKARLFKPSKS